MKKIRYKYFYGSDGIFDEQLNSFFEENKNYKPKKIYVMPNMCILSEYWEYSKGGD